MIRSAEAAASRDRKAAIMGLIETPRGVANVEAIAQAGGGLHALVFGGGDYQLDLGSFQRAVGAPSADYVVLTDDDVPGVRESGTGTTSGISPLRGSPMPAVLSAYSRSMGRSRAFQTSMACAPPRRRAAVLGFEGKMAIHPSQIEIIHEVFTPAAVPDCMGQRGNRSDGGG